MISGSQPSGSSGGLIDSKSSRMNDIRMDWKVSLSRPVYDAIEILGESMREVKRRAEVDADRVLHLYYGYLVASYPSHNIFWEFMSIVATAIPYGRANHLSSRCGEAENPWRIFRCHSGRRIEDGRWRTVKVRSLLLTYPLALSAVSRPIRAPFAWYCRTCFE